MVFYNIPFNIQQKMSVKLLSLDWHILEAVLPFVHILSWVQL